MIFLDQLYRFEESQICESFLIVATLSLVNQFHLKTATRAPDIFAIHNHGSADARDFLVQQEFFYTDQFMPKVSVSKLKRQHITKVSEKKYYNALFCINCGLVITSFSLADY